MSEHNDADDRTACALCPRFTTGYRCRASSLHPDRKKSEILWLYSQPEVLDIQAREPSVSGPTYSVMQTALVAIYRVYPELRKYHIRKSYAAQCVPQIEDEKPNKTVLESCKPLLQDVINETQPQLIVAFGATVLKQLGVHAKHTSVRGRILEPEMTGLPAPLLVTFSERAITAAPGIFETFKQDLRNSFNRLVKGVSSDTTLEELTKLYVQPSTMDEALELIERIMATPDSATLAVDTETTSLRPEKDGARIIAFCFSWGVGEATTILYDHPHAPQEYLDRLPELEAAIRRLLASKKPKILHNAKFDLKWIELKYGMPVNNVVWCTLLGEHLLDEDKKGNYGLKALTAVWLPKYCGYEDKLHDILSATEKDVIVEVDNKIAALPEEYQEYAGDLEGYKEQLKEYHDKKAAWTLEHNAYLAEVAIYEEKRAAHKAAVEAWKAIPKRPKKPVKPAAPRGAALDSDFRAYTAALLAYDAELAAWEAYSRPPEPVKDFTRPVKPASLESAPDEPKDPRSKTEKDYTTDGGFEKVPLAELQLYGGVDGDVTRRMCSIQLTRLAEEAKEAEVKVSPCRALITTRTPPTRIHRCASRPVAAPSWPIRRRTGARPSPWPSEPCSASRG